MRGLIQLDVGGAILETRPGKGANLGVKRFLFSFLLFFIFVLSFCKVHAENYEIHYSIESYNLNHTTE